MAPNTSAAHVPHVLAQSVYIAQFVVALLVAGETQEELAHLGRLRREHELAQELRPLVGVQFLPQTQVRLKGAALGKHLHRVQHLPTETLKTAHQGASDGVSRILGSRGCGGGSLGSPFGPVVQAEEDGDFDHSVVVIGG